MSWAGFVWSDQKQHKADHARFRLSALALVLVEVGRDILTVRSAPPAVFLDRDGVLNEAIIRNGKPDSPRDATELALAKGARAALDELKREGFLLIVVTNQPNIARGKTTRADVDQINARLAAVLPLVVLANLDRVVRAREKFGVNLAGSFMVGDLGAI
jgi:HAD superfamily hydrolase (TIGR01662 family)